MPHIWRMPPDWWYYVPVLCNYNYNTTQCLMCGESLLTVGTSTGLILIIVQTYQTMIIVSSGENPQTAQLRGYNCAPCAVILAWGKHPPTELRTLRGWSEPCTLTATQRGGDRASGASQIACLGSGKPPTRRNSVV